MLWVSAQQIAEAAAAGLMPGMPTSKRGVNKFAEAETWAERGYARIRKGREGGGGLEYDINALPLHARAAWIGHHLKVDPAALRPELSDEPATEAEDARRIIVRLAEQFRVQNRITRSAADALFCVAFNGGSIALPEWVKAEAKSLSTRTLARWRQAVAEGDRVRKAGRPKGSGVLDRAHGGEVRNLILGHIAKQPFLTARHLRAVVLGAFGDALEVVDPTTGEVRSVPVPSERMFQVAVAAWKKTYRNELMRLTDPDGHRSRIEFSATGSQRADRLNEIWQIDASPADVMLKGGRHSIYAAVDVYSRRMIVLVTPTPRAASVGLLIRKCLLMWGVPEWILTDNGSDFVAKATARLFAALEIQIHRSPAYEPKSKGIVERSIRTFQHDLAVVPGFIGHNVADRKVIEGRKAFSRRLGATDEQLFDVDMDIVEFQAWCDAWAEAYQHRKHGGLKGRMPFEAAASYGGHVRRVENEAALDVLLAPLASGDGTRRVTKQGVRIDGSQYLPMGVMPGTVVLVRMDPHDLGRVMLFDPETDGFLGEAICPELAGISPAEVIAETRKLQKAYEAENSAGMKRHMRQINMRSVADHVLRDGMRGAGKIAAFPQRSELHSTPALEGAAEAAGSAPAPASARPREVEGRPAAILKRFPPRPAAAPKERPEQRFRRALELMERISGRQPVAVEDADWLEGYRTSPEYRAQKMMFDQFGPAFFATSS